MEVVVALSLVLAGVIGGAGLFAVYRRRQAEKRRLRSDELRALDERIAARIAGLKGAEPGALPSRSYEGDDDPLPMPALLPVESQRSWAQRLGFGGSRESEGGGSGRGAVVRDTGIVLAVGVVLLLVASQLLPAATPPPSSTATPTTTDLTAILPTGTPNLLLPTATPTLAPGETATPTLDITFEPTPVPPATATPYVYVPPPPPGSTPNPTPKPTPQPTPKPTLTPDTVKG